MSDKSRNIAVRYGNNRRGVALLMVLFLVGAISILSLGFAIKADTELSCGRNVELRMQMDYLGLTALNHAKTLILNPQDVATSAQGYWQGDTDLQIEVGGEDFYDITVSRSTTGFTPESTFDVTCHAYRFDGVSKISVTNIQAQLRLDPCIAYWAGGNSEMHANMKVYGDTYCNGSLFSNGQIYGDVFSQGYSGWKTGQEKTVEDAKETKISWPGINASDFDPGYYIGSTFYSPVILSDSNYVDVTWSPDEVTNPAGIYYCDGDLVLLGDNTINGTLIVAGNLTFEDGQSTIVSKKNQPAIIVEGQLEFSNAGAEITGLVQTYTASVLSGSKNITITGGLFIRDDGLDARALYTGNIIVRGDPMKASIKVMPTASASDITEWTPIGGAYYKYIRRQ